jgi:hypothetical protein
MAFTVILIVVFGVAAVIPAVWSIVGLIQGNKNFWPGVLGAGWALGLLLVTIIGIATNWGGCSSSSKTSDGSVTCVHRENASDCKPDVWALECGRTSPGCTSIPKHAFCPTGQKPVFVFCEEIQEGSVKQPWATWSDLAFVAAGLWLLWFFHYFGTPGTTSWGSTFVSMTADNPMITIGWLSVSYGLIVIFMGPPSQWFHASMKEWGGWFDSMSVVSWLMFNAVYVFYLLAFAMWGRGRGIARPIAVLCIWGGLMILFGVIAMNPDARLYLYFASGGPWGVLEVIYVFVAAYASGVLYRRTWWLFVINLSLLAVTMTIWIFFNDGIVPPSWCQAGESFPGHAVFHILASFSTILTFASFASEQRVSG